MKETERIYESIAKTLFGKGQFMKASDIFTDKEEYRKLKEFVKMFNGKVTLITDENGEVLYKSKDCFDK